MNYDYDAQTINSSNPIARFAHRMRVRKSLRLINSRLHLGKILDYGCGSGALISELNALKHECAIGYEPFMPDRHKDGLPIYSTLDVIRNYAPYKTITIFEVLEHLQYSEIENILNTLDEILDPSGIVFVSVPIEIGPAVLLKEINRFRRTKKWTYGFFEFIRTLLIGIAGHREDLNASYMQHKGFDFRELKKFIEGFGWKSKTLSYSPLPIKTWYGNSQVFFALYRQSTPNSS